VASGTAQPWLDPAIADYITARAGDPDEVLAGLRAETEALGNAARMQISAHQGTLLTLLTAVAGASFAVEVGTFTGYSSICIARGLRPGGRLLCLDVSEEFTAYATRAWAKAGLDDRIELRLAPALDSLRALPADEHIDVAFIDADKPNYRSYFEELLTRLRPSGLIMVDNTLWSGRVADAAAGDDDENVTALRAFNDAVAGDDRVDSYLLPVSDGLTLIRKR
jgi:caffeoyl-CoA O-methyltransferase